MAVTDAYQPGQMAQTPSGTQSQRSPVLMALFLIAVMTPIQTYIGDFRVDPYRGYLLIAFFPAAFALMGKGGGRLALPDLFMGLYALWIMVAMIHNHGNWGFTNGGITVVELLGAYMLGRVLVRSVADFERLVRYILITLVLLSPLVAHEFFTGRWLIGEYVGRAFQTVGRAVADAERMGFHRVQASFPHAILYGLYPSMIFGCVYYLYRDRFAMMLRRLAFVGAMTFASLSSGPLLAVFVQGGLILWDRVTKGRWMLLAVLSVIGYVVIDFLSNRTPTQIFVQTFTLNPDTAYWRIHIFEYGKQAVLNNPIFGIGHHDHPRPFWLTDSVDNFWLLNAMRYGLVGFGFLAGAVLLSVFNIIRAKNLSPAAQNARLAFLISFAGLAFTLSTVHVWNSISSLVFFFIGAGAFLYTGGDTGEAEHASTDPDPDLQDDTAGTVRYRRPVRNEGTHARGAGEMPFRRHPSAASPDAPIAPQRQGPTFRR